jgi:hypothetical protein
MQSFSEMGFHTVSCVNSCTVDVSAHLLDFMPNSSEIHGATKQNEHTHTPHTHAKNKARETVV